MHGGRRHDHLYGCDHDLHLPGDPRRHDRTLGYRVYEHQLRELAVSRQCPWSVGDASYSLADGPMAA